MHASAVPQRRFTAAMLLLFAGSTALTVAACRAMVAMHAMPMPGGWTLSMMWMRMPGRSWAGMALDFLAMWTAMMVAMMLPSLWPMLRRYRNAVPARGARREVLTALAGAGYFAVWALAGGVAFVAGTASASLALNWPDAARAMPAASGVIVSAAGALQFSAWKAQHLACCRGAGCAGGELPAGARGALRHGLRLG